MGPLEQRESILKSIVQEDWDVIIIGGGITGAGIFREAARRNLKVLLVEQKDFAWGTSSRSSKMVHGGLRYLKEGNIGLTFESVRERKKLIEEVPFLIEEKSYLLPSYRGHFMQRMLIGIGLFIYDSMAVQWKSHRLSSQAVLRKIPFLRKKDLVGAFCFHDAVTDDARLVLKVIDEGRLDGGSALNYCKVQDLIFEKDQVRGVHLKDEETGNSFKAKAKVVINATGIWVNELRKQVVDQVRKIRPLRGSHLLFPKACFPLQENISLIHPQDNRPLLVMNWEGCVLVGTTDLDHSDHPDQEARISPQEVDYLMEALIHFFPQLQLTEDHIQSSIAGVRPVLDSGKANPSQESRDHVIWQDKGLITVTGGKLTTFRVLALETLKKTQKQLGSLPDLDEALPVFSPYEQTPLTNALGPKAEMQRLWARYGVKAEQMLADTPDFTNIEGTNTLWLELEWAAAHEQVVHLDDLLLRRTRLGLLVPRGAEELLSEIQNRCFALLDWDEKRWEREKQDYLNLWKKYYSVPF